MRAVLIIAVVAFCSTAHAAKPKALIAAYQVKAAQFAEQDLKREFTPEVGAMQGWLGEAKAFMASDDGKRLRMTLARVRVQSRLIEALLDRTTAKSAAEAARAEASAAEQAADAAEKAATDVEQALAELERKETGK